MARRSKKQRMKALSWLIFLAFVGLVAAGVLQIRQDDVLTGAELIGRALLSLPILLGFTCRIDAGSRLVGTQHAGTMLMASCLVARVTVTG